MKTAREHQKSYKDTLFYNDDILKGISGNVKLHIGIKNPLSSAAACLNVLGYLNQNPSKIIPFFDALDFPIEEVIGFPRGADLGGEVYDDTGPFVFEYTGPKKSPINEKGGSRGHNKTSIDALFIARVRGMISQVFIEWKFTERYTSGTPLHRFGGKRGVERLRRYSPVLANFRNNGFPFRFKDEDSLGLQDFSYEPLYQLLRMTLLAKTTTPITMGSVKIEDYYVLHLVHSENTKLLEVKKSSLKYCPGIIDSEENDLHKLWLSLLSDDEKRHFKYGYWNKALSVLDDERDYLTARYM